MVLHFDQREPLRRSQLAPKLTGEVFGVAVDGDGNGIMFKKTREEVKISLIIGERRCILEIALVRGQYGVKVAAETERAFEFAAHGQDGWCMIETSR